MPEQHQNFQRLRAAMSTQRMNRVAIASTIPTTGFGFHQPLEENRW
jgi:hypothetical protein